MSTEENRSPLRRLNEEKRQEFPVAFPLRALQFGEGNFLRAFIDWMFQRLNDAGLLRGSIQIVEPLPSGMGNSLNEQSGLYTVWLRGLENGKVIEKTELISCVRGALNAYRDWSDVLATAREESLQFVFSNTTEAGIEYVPEAYSPEFAQSCAPGTFPAKLTAFLHERYRHFSGRPGTGLMIVPCELIERNATFLKEYVLQYASDWNLESGFSEWIDNDNRFINTLVDRIVSGYPAAEAMECCERLGYEDRLLVAGEPFHFFALEGPESLDAVLPLRQAGLNVVWTDDIAPYRERKVLLLNGGHTSTALAAFLAGLDQVDEMIDDPVLGQYLRSLLYHEVLPLIDLPREEKTAFLEAVLERFANPFTKHQLYSIALNSLSKWKVRVLPGLLAASKKTGRLPRRIVFSLAALIVFYENSCGEGQRENGKKYEIPDNPEIVRFFEMVWNGFGRSNDPENLVREVLSRTDFWNGNLHEIPFLAELVADDIVNIKKIGIRETIRQMEKLGQT